MARIPLRILVFLALLVAVAGRSASPAAAQEDGAIEACGTVQTYIAATATIDGRITVGTRAYTLAADDLYRQQAARNSTYIVGRATCLTGVMASGRVSQYGSVGFPEQLCGVVLAFRPPAATLAGTVTLRDLAEVTLAIPPGTETGPVPVTSSRACFTLALERSGDAIASGRVLTIAERTAALVSVCGTVSEWTRPVSTAPADTLYETEGIITVGTHRFVIAAGTTYSLVNSVPVVGRPTCLLGALDRSGRLIQYAAQPGLPDCTGGAVAALVRPTDRTAGMVRFASPGPTPYTADSHLFAIPAGTALPPNAGDGTQCFTLAIGRDGDAIVSGARPAGLGSLPSTSTR